MDDAACLLSDQLPTRVKLAPSSNNKKGKKDKQAKKSKDGAVPALLMTSLCVLDELPTHAEEHEPPPPPPPPMLNRDCLINCINTQTASAL